MTNELNLFFNRQINKIYFCVCKYWVVSWYAVSNYILADYLFDHSAGNSDPGINPRKRIKNVKEIRKRSGTLELDVLFKSAWFNEAYLLIARFERVSDVFLSLSLVREPFFLSFLTCFSLFLRVDQQISSDNSHGTVNRIGYRNLENDFFTLYYSVLTTTSTG